MNKKLIISLSMIAATAVIVIGATTAYFSNTETSTGNTFIAGAIDLKIDNECHYNGNVCVDGVWEGTNDYPVPGTKCDCTWKLTDLDGKAIFSFTDVKPGDDGEDTISLHVDSNPAWVCAEISNVMQAENNCNPPEFKAETAEYGPGNETCGDPGAGQGELWNNLTFSIWMDKDCDNVYDPEDVPYLVENAKATDLKWPIADSKTGAGPIRDACIGVAWAIPAKVGNIIQGDNVTGDITFKAYQARHNENFICNPPQTVCGNGNVEPPETCELPNTLNNPFCVQTTSECSGLKTMTRDGYGNCGGSCGCVFDPFSGPVCIKDSCGAQCAVDKDCDDGISTTTDICLDGCTCEHINQTVCGDGDLDPGEQCDDGNTTPGDGCSAVCQNEYAYLIVHKDVVNNEIGTKNPGDFQMTIDTVNAAQDVEISVGANVSHAVSEVNTFGYIKTYGGACDADGNVIVAYNETKTCNVKNEMPYGTITVTKQVTNNNGGLLTVGSFTLKIDGDTVTSSSPKNVAVGAHSVSEDGVFGYSATFSGDCNASGDVSVGAGENKSCVITNDDIAPSIELVKSVVGGSALPDDFDVSIDHVVKTSGSQNPVMANTAHVIDEEVMVSGYSFTSLTGTSFKGVPCPTALEGTITLLPGDVVTCTIKNTHQ